MRATSATVTIRGAGLSIADISAVARGARVEVTDGRRSRGAAAQKRLANDRLPQLKLREPVPSVISGLCHRSV